MQERKRLHISPFNPELLPIILSADILKRASNVSFHTIQTSQERNYGFLDLPEMDAEQVRKKLNGSIIKGSKMRVEDARPEKTRNVSTARNTSENQILLEDGPSEERQRRGRKKADKVDGILPGIELPGGRTVKRGWTEPAAASKSSKALKKTAAKHDRKSKSKPSSFTNGRECLFKTKLPPNAVASNTKAVKRKRGGSGGDIVVHEFEHTTKHATFLRDVKGSIGPEVAAEYLEGQGWMDRNGNIIEGPKARRNRPTPNKGKEILSTAKNNEDIQFAKYESSKNSSIPVSDSAKTGEVANVNDETSSSGTSSSSGDDGEGNSTTTSAHRINGIDAGTKERATPLSSEDEHTEDETIPKQVRAMSVSNDSSADLRANGGSSERKQTADNVHPLQVLFKRPKFAASSTPKKPNLEVSTSFNFFDPDADEVSSNGYLVPHTPFTQQDFRERRQRSAAPTPDTAAPGKSFGNLWVDRSENDKEEDEEEEEKEVFASKSNSAKEHDVAQGAGGEEKPESEFSRWFWEHRGETNRAWKRRRREAAKEKRQKNNKKT
ncbi:hypothetical protein MMC07_003439 [Pseudocyphellaria aurata]|nr:hypothetical protein [Pseudocyphellaria aurata]